ncbi:hypothetical protein NPS74_22070, partial [Cutibacterium acnes subsp. acnes]|nr:hypothetical protein [Cutibacterium acnes subsp. acnes]
MNILPRIHVRSAPGGHGDLLRAQPPPHGTQGRVLGGRSREGAGERVRAGQDHQVLPASLAGHRDQPCHVQRRPVRRRAQLRQGAV